MADSALLKNTAISKAVDLSLVHNLRAEESVNTPSALNLHVSNDDRLDHFITRHGVRCAGAHLIIDLYNATGLDNMQLMHSAMVECVEKAGATLLHIHLHHFEPNGGISGVAVLAESHISVHTWPEFGYAAFDVFMCGDAEPHKAIDVLKNAFKPDRVILNEFMRGQAV